MNIEATLELERQHALGREDFAEHRASARCKCGHVGVATTRDMALRHHGEHARFKRMEARDAEKNG